MAQGLPTKEPIARRQKLTRRAMLTLHQLSLRYPDELQYASDYAQACETLAQYLGSDSAEGLQLVHEALRVVATLIERRPTAGHFPTIQNLFRRTLGFRMLARGDLATTQQLIDQIRPAQEALLARYPNDEQRYLQLPGVDDLEGALIVKQGHDWPRLAKLLLGRMSRTEQLLTSRPDNPVFAKLVMLPCANVHVLDRVGQTAAADEILRRGLAFWETYAPHEPNDPPTLVELILWRWQTGWRDWSTDRELGRQSFGTAIARADQWTKTAVLDHRCRVFAAYLHLLCPDPTLRDLTQATKYAEAAGVDGQAVLGCLRAENHDYAGAVTALTAHFATPRPREWLGDAVPRFYLALALHHTGQPAPARQTLDQLEAELAHDNWVGPETWALRARVWQAVTGAVPPQPAYVPR
jgi:hypothetical protein